MSLSTRQTKRARRRAPTYASPWPSGLHAELLKAALLDGPAAIAALRAWRAGADLDRLDQASFRLVPLVYRNLERLRADDPWMPTMKGIYRRAWVENQVLFRRLAGVVAVLDGAGIPTIVLKGAALADQAYHDAGARPMADVDVWVRAGRFAAALEALRSAGWLANPKLRAEIAADPCRFRALRGAISLRMRGDAVNVLDLHQDILGIYHQYSVPLPEERFWDASERFTVQAVATRRLAPHHQLIHVLFHGLQSQPLPTIRWVADADRLIRACGARLDWDALLAEAADLLLVAPLREGLEHLEETYGTPVPERVLASLRRSRVSFVERCERRVRRADQGLAGDLCASLVPLLRHARRPGTGFLRALGREHVRRLVLKTPWNHLVRRPVRALARRFAALRAPADGTGITRSM